MQRARAIALMLMVCLSVFVAKQALAAAPTSSTQVNIGHSLIPLYGPWKFQVGDSPVEPGSSIPLWATPGFDDSSWETVDLTPEANSFDPNIGVGGYVPGWTARNHPGYFGYAWYRLRIRVTALPGIGIALQGPSDVDDAYQVFANGKLLGSFGAFPAGRKPVLYNSQPRMFAFPGGADEVVEVAFRVWMDASTTAYQTDAGGIHSAPLLGEASVISNHFQLDWLQLVRAYGGSAILLPPFFLVTLIAFCLMLFDPSDGAYPWLAAAFLLTFLRAFALVVIAWTTYMESVTGNVILSVLAPLTIGVWLMVWWRWFQLERPSWMPVLISALTLACVISTLFSREISLSFVPPTIGVVGHYASLVMRSALLVLLIFIVDRGIRTRGNEGWIALPAVVLVGIAQFQFELGRIGIRFAWFPFGAQLTLATISNLILSGVILVLIARRLLLSLHRQREFAQDLKQAKEVQHVLLPEPLKVAGLNILAEYRPAREVGGDFFQIVPHPTDGSVLIVTGDVVGKGLQAGMLVALLVGAIRSTAELNSDPQFVLEALNRRLLGRGDARATCLALRIEPNGSVTLANAGHLPPYLNDVEVPMEGALPLGCFAAAEFPVSHFHLGKDDVLTLVSDGVVEAQDKNRDMFGFERVRELLRAKTSPAALAAAAQQFGQEDDISILSISRAIAEEPVRTPILDRATGPASAPLHA